ncbi:hypothetical protein, partial [uncultured Fibrobacter sp.]|uniref:hypothetical protein n=1 Tax=uncultured Fibrobacter sp. TaxID=261512 RepID=UPI0025D4DA57
VTVVKGFWRKISTFFTFSQNNGIYSTLYPLYQHIVHKNLFFSGGIVTRTGGPFGPLQEPRAGAIAPADDLVI